MARCKANIFRTQQITPQFVCACTNRINIIMYNFEFGNIVCTKEKFKKHNQLSAGLCHIFSLFAINEIPVSLITVYHSPSFCCFRIKSDQCNLKNHIFEDSCVFVELYFLLVNYIALFHEL